MTNETPGYGYPSEPNPQNPYGQQPPQQPGYGVPQGPYDPQPGGPGPGTPPPGYGYPPPPPGGYPTSGGAQLPPWLGAPNPYGPTPPGTRVLARLIDWVILIIPVLIVEFAVAAAIGTIMSSIISGLVVFGYEALMMTTQDQQTIGKKVMKLRVVSAEHGGRPIDNELWIRSAVYGLPQAVYCVGSLFYLVNVLSLLWDKPLQQCFHDKAAKTLVVKES